MFFLALQTRPENIQGTMARRDGKIAGHRKKSLQFKAFVTIAAVVLLRLAALAIAAAGPFENRAIFLRKLLEANRLQSG